MIKTLKPIIALGLAGCLTLGATTVQGLKSNVQSQRALDCHSALDFGPKTLDASYLEEQALAAPSTQAVQPIAEKGIEADVRKATTTGTQNQHVSHSENGIHAIPLDVLLIGESWKDGTWLNRFQQDMGFSLREIRGGKNNFVDIRWADSEESRMAFIQNSTPWSPGGIPVRAYSDEELEAHVKILFRLHHELDTLMEDMWEKGYRWDKRSSHITYVQKLNFLLMDLLDAPDEKNPLTRSYITFIQSRIFPLLEEAGNVYQKSLRTPGAWAYYALGPRDVSENGERFWRRIARFVRLFSEPEIILSGFGPHLRADFTPSDTTFDLPIYPFLFYHVALPLQKTLTAIQPVREQIRDEKTAQLKARASRLTRALLNSLIFIPATHHVKDDPSLSPQESFENYYRPFFEALADFTLRKHGVDLRVVLEDAARILPDEFPEIMPTLYGYAGGVTPDFEVYYMAAHQPPLEWEDVFLGKNGRVFDDYQKQRAPQGIEQSQPYFIYIYQALRDLRGSQLADPSKRKDTREYHDWMHKLESSSGNSFLDIPADSEVEDHARPQSTTADAPGDADVDARASLAAG